MKERASYEWKTTTSFGKAMPPMRVNSSAAVANESVWLIGGKGVGLSNEVWRFPLDGPNALEWECEKTTGDPPLVRDSHTLTYIGGDKLLLFGGQGLHNDNDRTLRQTKTQTYKVFQARELFNDTHIFDVSKLQWSRVHCKSQVPFSRRGHSATWVPPFYSDRITRPGPPNPLIPDGSLILFGGSGMDTFTGIEVAFNDMWIYYPDREWWESIITRGIPPIPTFLHTATLQGDFLVTIGGLADPSPPTSMATTGKDKKIVQITNYQKPVSGVMLFNIRTLCWSHLELSNPTTMHTMGKHNHARLLVLHYVHSLMWYYLLCRGILLWSDRCVGSQ